MKPNNNSLVTCPESCLTLDQYAQQTTNQCFSTGSTLLFLPGNHTLHSKVQLENVSDILLSGEEEKGDVRIILSETGLGIHCENVMNLQIEGITFHVLNSKRNLTPFLTIINSRDVLLYNLTFQGGKAVHYRNSNVSIVRCLFKENTGYNGGAVSVTEDSNVTIDGNIFIDNEAMGFGGAIYVINSSLVLLESCTLGNRFTYNAAQSGGAIFLNNSKIDIINNSTSLMTTPVVESTPSQTGYTQSTSTFSHNKALFNGGAIYFLDCKASLNGAVTNFQNNNARTGGAIFIVGTTCTLLLGGGIANFVNNSAI